jgi:hypothetical protein
MIPRVVAVATIVVVAATTIASAQMSSSAAAGRTISSTSNPAASPTTSTSSRSLTPGTIIQANNADQYANYLPVAATLALKHGLKIEVTPTERLQWSVGFQTATEKYSPQVGLDRNDYITNYIAGMPFPLIDTNDPKAAIKIAYNWHMGPVIPDDFQQTPWTSNGYRVDHTEASRILPSNDANYACDKLQLLRFAHRTEVDPRPTLGDNDAGVEWKEKCDKWSEISTGSTEAEGSGIHVRYLDPRRDDEFYAFMEDSRRVRRMTIDFPYPNQKCRACHQPYWAYALPKTEVYSYRLLGTTALLASVNASDEPAGLNESSGDFNLTREPFELRRAYIIEMTPSKKDLPERTLVFIDSEIYVWLAAEFYEGGQRVATTIPLWRMHPASGGGHLFHLAGSFFFPDDKSDFFRSLVPAHFPFEQQINTGALSASEFNPQSLAH